MSVLSPDAVLDVERVRSFLDEINANAAQKALGQIWSALERVQHFPNAGLRTSDPAIRQIIVRLAAPAMSLDMQQCQTATSLSRVSGIAVSGESEISRHQISGDDRKPETQTI